MPLGASTLQNSALGPLSGASSCHLPGVPLSPLYHANFSRDNFSTMSPPARTETLYGAGPREAAALPRQTKAHCCCGTCLRLSGQFAERAASSPRRGSTWSAASWRLIKISITAPKQGGARRGRLQKPACAGSRAARRPGLLGRERGGLGEKNQAPKLKHLIRLISSRTNVPPRGRLLGTKIIL